MVFPRLGVLLRQRGNFQDSRRPVDPRAKCVSNVRYGCDLNQAAIGWFWRLLSVDSTRPAFPVP